MSFQPGATLNTMGFGNRPESVEVPHIDLRAPNSSDINYPLGKHWLDRIAGNEYVLANFISLGGVTTANWVLLGSSASSLNTLTGSSGGPIAPVSSNINILGNSLGSFVGTAGTLTYTPTASGYPVTPFVVGPSGQAGYQTIQSAVNAANSAGGGVVLVQPGSYTESLTLFSNCHIMGLDFSDAGGGVNITGVHTPPASGGFVFNNVRLISATHIFSSVAAGTAHLVIANAEIFVTNGYTFNLPNWTGKLESFDVNAAVGTNDGYVNNTGGSEVDLFECSVGSGTVNTMICSGFTLGAGSNLYCPLNIQSGQFVIDYCTFNKTVTFSGSSTGTITTSHFTSGAVAAITMSSSASCTLSTCVINSSNNPAIAGSGVGTLTLGDITFLSNSALAGTLTTSFVPTRTGNILASGPGNGLQIKSGTNARIGSATLTGGSSGAIANTSVTASTIILTSVSALGTVTTAKAMLITKNAGVGFTITSADATDTSTVQWTMIESI